MDVQKLIDLGFQVSGGQIDHNGANYGHLGAAGVILTPEGEALAASLSAPAKPAAKSSRKKAAAETAAEGAGGGAGEGDGEGGDTGSED